MPIYVYSAIAGLISGICIIIVKEIKQRKKVKYNKGKVLKEDYTSSSKSLLNNTEMESQPQKPKFFGVFGLLGFSSFPKDSDKPDSDN